MATKNIWQESCDLTDSLLGIGSGIHLPVGKNGDRWVPLVTVGLSQANERLASIRLLLNRNSLESAMILVRSLFEIAVNLCYIDKDVEGRLEQYLKHGNIPRNRAEAFQLDERLEKGGASAAMEMIPTRAWKSVREMCADLDPEWSREHETLYRYSSISAHAGSAFLGDNYARLVERQQPSTREKASHLLTGAELHSRVVEVASRTFPEHFDSSRIATLRNHCGRLGSIYLQGNSW